MKATAIANSNIALVKYWGKYDEKLNLPMNGSISLTLDALKTTTTVNFSEKFKEDIIKINGKDVKDVSKKNIISHLDLIRKLAKIKYKAEIASENNFPMGTGLASSASGYAALTVAACAAAGLDLDKKGLSIISRQGSGSACRSIYGGYVEWLAAKKSEESYAAQIADENYFDIRDIVAIVVSEEKKTSSRNGMTMTVKTSPLYHARLSTVNENLGKIKKAILNKDFTSVGQIAEFDSLLMHATMLTTKPALLYWSSGTISVMQVVEELRNEGVEAYYTIDAGPNVHVLVLPENSKEVERRLREVSGIINVVHNKPGGDAEISKKHLF